MRPTRPILAALCTLALLATSTGAAFPSAASTGGPSSAPGGHDAGVSGSDVRGVGLLPSFAASGANLIRLQSASFDPLAGPPPVPGGSTRVAESDLPAGVSQYWIVQVSDQRFADATAAITSAGASIAGPIHDDAYMVRATPAQVATIAASPAVRWTGYYQPAWRFPAATAGRPGLLELAGVQSYRVYAFRTDPAASELAQALSGLANVAVLGDGGVTVDVAATAAEVPAIAALPSVQWVSVSPRFVPMNNDARWVVDTGVRDLHAALRPDRLTGAGQTAAVADTSLNYKVDALGTAHEAFRDCAGPGLAGCLEADFTQAAPGNTTAAMVDVVDNATGNRKMAAFFDLGGVGPNPPDESSHGTHVSGSVAGDAGTPGTWDGQDGLAPAARLVFQAIATPDGTLGGSPVDYYQLFRQAYRPSNPAGVPESSPAEGNAADRALYVPTVDARTHNNSYGLGIPVADLGDSAIVDQFVWDHEDMDIVISAGNAGPAPGSISSPAVSKNGFVSAASSNGRQLMVSIGDLASFSSHGPTGDGRFGPLVATPGEVVVSAKGGTNDGYHYLQGTSMSAPVLTGALTDVRQYFWDGYGPANGKGAPAGTASASRSWNPSAALVRAVAANGAERMRGWQTGEDGSNRALDGQWPSAGQGFGRLNLDNSLYFADDPLGSWYYDVYRSDAESFDLADLGASRSYQLDVAEGQPLDVTLSWTDAPDLLFSGTPALVNNLDLVVTGPSGQVYIGNNMNSRAVPSVDVAESPTPPTSGPDTLNNTERVRVAAPAPGTYTVTVVASKIMTERQGFALAASGNVAPAGGTFVPGPPRQVDQPGAPSLSPIGGVTASSDNAKLTFTTSEPTTAAATINGVTYPDVYNFGGTWSTPSTYPGFDTAPVETGPDYANKPVLSTQHEIYLTGLSPRVKYLADVVVTDLAGNTAARTVKLRTPRNVFQPAAADMAQLDESGASPSWKTGKQFYAGFDPSGPTGYAGAFMFRIPDWFDPARITGAYVELTAAHDLSPHYLADPLFTVSLLDDSVKADWGTQSYDTIHKAAATAVARPSTTVRSSSGSAVDFTFGCADLAALRASLSSVVDGQRLAPFRWDSTHTDVATLVSMEFGFNRRGHGPDLRPKLVLVANGVPLPAGAHTSHCDPSTPAPTISNVAIDNSYSSDGGENVFTQNQITVSWLTDVESDSLVLFRKKGTKGWIQVGSPARSRVHQVSIDGIDTTEHYEFGVRSTACNGASTTDDNGGAGYDLWRPPPAGLPDPGNPTPLASFTFDSGEEGWTIAGDPGTVGQWQRGSDGAASPAGWHFEPYGDNANQSVVSPPIVVNTAWVGVAAFVRYNTEFPAYPGGVATSTDGLRIEYSADGTTWTQAPDAIYGGMNASWPAYDEVSTVFLNPNPGGSLLVRFRMISDSNTSSPPFVGAAFDQVTLSTYDGDPPPPPADPFVLALGPVPPKSAGASGLGLAAVRTRPSGNAADQAAGTGFCPAS